MTPALPPVFFPSPDFTLAELSAARLDGELVSIDDAFSPVDQPMTMSLRLQSLAPMLAERVIIERQSALWVYGFRPFPPTPHQCCVRTGARWRVRDSARMTLREVVVRDDDVVTHYGVPITSRLRTAVDIARTEPDLDAVALQQLSDLLRTSGIELEECRAHLNRTRNTPHKARALTRLASALAFRMRPDAQSP